MAVSCVDWLSSCTCAGGEAGIWGAGLVGSAGTSVLVSVGCGFVGKFISELSLTGGSLVFRTGVACSFDIFVHLRFSLGMIVY